MKPSGKFVMEDLYRLGGTPALMKFLAAEGLIDDSQLTVTGTPPPQNKISTLSLNPKT
jgi:dihydroxy-acid dehydratase